MVELRIKSTHGETRSRDFFKFHLFIKSPMKLIYYIASLIVFIIGVVFIGLMKTGLSLFFFFIAIMILILRVVITNIMINGIVKKISYQSLNYEIRINDKELVYVVDVNKKIYQLKDLEIFEVENYYYFYINKNSAYIINKYAISEVERLSLNEMLTKNNYNYKIKKFK